MAAHLRQRLVRGLPWAIGEALFNSLYGILTVVIIGRFISPGELGAATTATATILMIEVVSSAGILEAVVRSRSADTIVTDTAFVMAVAFAFFGMGVCALAAFPIAALFDDHRLVALTVAASLMLPLNAIATVPSAILTRKMRAAKLTRRLIGGKLCGLVTLTIFAVIGWGAWSVVLSNLATSFGSLVMILIATNRWPRIRFSSDAAPALLRFGAMISAEATFYTITPRAFSILFGYFHGLAALGNFQVAWRLAEEVAALVQTSVSRFGLSFFAGKERTAADVTFSFLTGTQLIAAITTPAFAGIALVANDFVPLVFGSRWEASIPFLQIMAISLLVAFQRILTWPALRAKGYQKVAVSFSAAGAAFALIACFATAHLPAIYGVIGFASRLFFIAPFTVLVIERLLRISLKTQASALIGPTAATAVMAVAVVTFQQLVADTVPVVHLTEAVVIGTVVYLSALWFFCPSVPTFVKIALSRRMVSR